MTNWRIKVLYDGACPLCRREVQLWRRLDRDRGHIATEDISAAGFDPNAYGLSHDDVMDQIHGVLPSGKIVSGMDVIRRAYQAVGWGWIMAPTGWPILAPVFDRLYRWFARNRLRITGRHKSDCDACDIREARDHS